MTSLLVGHTGFVGSNLDMQAGFHYRLNSKNINEGYGLRPDLLVYAGVYAQKFLANQFPENDLAHVNSAIENIRKIQPRQIILISTIDVYDNPVNVHELSFISKEKLQPYGKHRLLLEEFVCKNFPEHLVVRLPALYGSRLKKNFIFDMLNAIPVMLNSTHFKRLTDAEDKAKEYYRKLPNGYYEVLSLNQKEKATLSDCFRKAGFNALHFTDSRSVFQFYPVRFLWEHLQLAMKHGIRKLNMATEPLTAAEIYQYATGKKFSNTIHTSPPVYNFLTRYDHVFSGEKGYVYKKEFIQQDIKEFYNQSVQ